MLLTDIFYERDKLHTILILGSAGQIGGHLSKYLKNKGYDVKEFDIESNPAQDLRLIPSKDFELLVLQCDFVFFLAFDVGGSHYLATYQDTFEFIDNNLKIITNTIGVLNKYNKPFLFASSQMSNMNQSTYGLLKAVGERFTYSANGRVVKFWNVYGYEKNHDKFHVISDFIKMAKESGVIKMKTNGLETRDFLYADDCCEALETVMLNYDRFDQDKQLHLAHFKWNSIFEVAEIIAEHFNSKIVQGDSGDIVQQEIKNEPSKYILDYWQPVTSLRSGIEKIIQFEDIS